MKKLAVLLQVIGLLAVCPLYVVLEITHGANEKSALSIQPKTETMSPAPSTVPASKAKSTSYDSNMK
jgi:hypothetical protein